MLIKSCCLSICLEFSDWFVLYWPGNYCCYAASSWVSSVGVCRGSDLAASGAGNGSVHLWAIEGAGKGIRPLYDLPLVSVPCTMQLNNIFDYSLVMLVMTWKYAELTEINVSNHLSWLELLFSLWLEEIDKDTKRFMPRFLMFIKWNYWICICSPSTRQHCFPLFLFSALLSSPVTNVLCNSLLTNLLCNADWICKFSGFCKIWKIPCRWGWTGNLFAFGEGK